LIASVTWQEGAEDGTVEGCLERRRQLAWTQYDEDEVVEESVVSREVTLCDRPAVRIQGLWRNVKHTIGGAFLTYRVSVPERGRTVMLDFYLYAPGMEQVAFLREMEAIALTFVCSPK